MKKIICLKVLICISCLEKLRVMKFFSKNEFVNLVKKKKEEENSNLKCQGKKIVIENFVGSNSLQYDKNI